MNITHLKYAAEVARTGSISQAAENLFMSQPNLSKAVREFENAMGFTIFKRTSKGIELTARGADFLAYAETILTEIDEMERRYQDGGDLQTSFRLSVPRASYITHAFTQFLNRLPTRDSFDFSFEETNSMASIDNLINGKCDIGIIRCRLENKEYFYRLLQDKGLTHRRIFTYEYRLLFSKEHPLATEPLITYRRLGGFTEILHGDLTVPFLSTNENAFDRGSRKKVYVYERGSQFDLLRKVHDTYMWVSPMPEELLQNYGLVQKRCDAQSHLYCDILIYKRGHRPTENETLFLDTLEEVIGEISK